MSVREQAYREVYTWLNADKKERGLEPVTPEGMHQMSILEWEAGAEEAYCVYEAEESQWSVLEDFLVFAIKAGILIGVMSAIYWIHNPWSMVLGGVIVLYLTKRWLK